MVQKFMLAAFLAAATARVEQDEVLATFAHFKSRFRRKYQTATEEVTRLDNFRASLERVRLHNAQPGKIWTRGINQFSDMSDGEFAKLHLMESQDCSATQHGSVRMQAPLADDLPPHMDWRERPGVISEVKNQGHCGSCWSFSTVGCLEAHMAIKYDSWRAPRLSEQQLVDCAQAFDNDGCRGGLPSHAFEYIRWAGGLDTEFHYHYTAVDGNCSFNASEPVPSPFVPRAAAVGAQVPGGSVNLTAGDEMSLKYYLATHGPVSVAYQVASDFRDYAGGVYQSELCESGPQDVNHAVLAVGYGTDPATGLDYWLCKNSWDYSFGEEGFFKILAWNNSCGIADCMSFPDLYGLNDEAPVPVEPKGTTCVGAGCNPVLLSAVSAIVAAIIVALVATIIVRSQRKGVSGNPSLATSLQPAEAP